MRSLASVKGGGGMLCNDRRRGRVTSSNETGSELGIKEGGANIKEKSNCTTLIILDVEIDQETWKKKAIQLKTDLKSATAK